MNVIFEVYIFSRIFKKRDLRENTYSAKMSTFTVLYLTFGFTFGLPNRIITLNR